MVVFSHRLGMRPSSSSKNLAIKRCAHDLILVVAFALCLASTNVAKAEVLFEGYAKVLLSGAHVGYVVQRYEFDSKKKEFTTTSYLRTNPVGGNITESLKARSSASLKPLSYQYTSLAGGTGKTIDATFKNDELTAVVRENGKVQTNKRKIPKDAFLASFLAYLMLQGKEGIKPGVRYGYQAIAEETGGVSAGEAAVEKEEVINGITTFKVLNTFNGTRFVSNVTHKGEVLATRSPVQQVATELVAEMKDATNGMPFNSNSISMLFGSVPKGIENAVARKATGAVAPDTKTPSVKGATEVPVTKDKTILGVDETETPAMPESAPGIAPVKAGPQKQQILNATPTPNAEEPKKEGVPAGQGIMIKGAPTAAPTENRK